MLKQFLKKRIIFVMLSILMGISFSAHADVSLPQRQDLASLQRGAKWYMNACAGCHSLKYVRYEQLSQDLHIPPELLMQTLNFTGTPISSTIETALAPEDAARWFGVMPPDLTLIVQARGRQWVYDYLNHFYTDERRLWGSNNLTAPNTAMPNVLLHWRGQRMLKTSEGETHLQIVRAGRLTPSEFDQMTQDVVNFLDYTSYPARQTRYLLGGMVLFGLSFLVLIVGCLWRSQRRFFKQER